MVYLYLVPCMGCELGAINFDCRLSPERIILNIFFFVDYDLQCYGLNKYFNSGAKVNVKHKFVTKASQLC